MGFYSEILNCIYAAIDDINQYQEEGLELLKSEDTILLGSGSNLDSLGFVSIIFEIEERLNNLYQNEKISLLNDKVMYGTENPFKNIKSLVLYIIELYNNRKQ